MSLLLLPLQGKGLLSTYWVTEKKAVDNQEETMLMLNPFQRLRQSRSTSSHPLCSTHPAIAQPQSFITPPKAVSQMAFPKPDEWPEANRRLSMDVRHRSDTIPTIEVPLSELHHSNESRASIGSCNYPQRSRSSSIVSESNLRDSTACPLPTIAEASPLQLAVFVALANENARQADENARQADENARQARQLADWAAELTRRSSEGSIDPSHTDIHHLEGTPVDPPKITTQLEKWSQNSGPKADCKIL